MLRKYSYELNNGILTVPHGETYVCNVNTCRFTKKEVTGIVLPSTVQYIGAYAFNFPGLKAINIPNRIKDIHFTAFAGCPNLERIYVSPTFNKKILDKVFEGYERKPQIVAVENNAMFGKQSAVKANHSKTTEPRDKK